MPDWLSNLIVHCLLPLAVSLIEKYAIPAFEKEFPNLIPILDELLKVIRGGKPSMELHNAANHYVSLKV